MTGRIAFAAAIAAAFLAAMFPDAVLGAAGAITRRLTGRRRMQGWVPGHEAATLTDEEERSWELIAHRLRSGSLSWTGRRPR